MLTDRYGLALSTTSTAARDAYVDGVDRLLAAIPGAAEAFDRAIEEDPSFALAHAARARIMQLGNRPDAAREAGAEATARSSGASARERAHVEIFSRLVNGRGVDALALTREHLGEHPRDALALSPCVGVFGLFGFSGDPDREQSLADFLESLAPHYDDDWWFLSAHAFALVENGQAARGRDLVERSLGHQPRSANGAHIYAHALYELADDDTATHYLEEWLPHYSALGQMHCHLWWHRALMHLFRGDAVGMWQAYLEHCAPDVSRSPPINIVTDGVSLLWRAELAGLERDRQRWELLRGYIEQQFPAPPIFIDVHYGFCLAALGDDDALDAYLVALRAAEHEHRLVEGPAVPHAVEAARAFVRGENARVIQLLETALGQVVRIGGSRAQRDLVLGTLIAACLNCERLDQARTWLSQRGARSASLPIAGIERLAS